MSICLGAVPDAVNHRISSPGYRRTALVVWPESRNNEIVHGKKYPNFVLNALKTTDSAEPDEHDLRLVEYIFGLLQASSQRESYRHPKDPFKITPSQVAQAVCAAACSWSDGALWGRAVSTCKCEDSIRVLGVPAILEAIQCIPLEDVLPRYDIFNQITQHRRLTSQTGSPRCWTTTPATPLTVVS